MSEDVKTGPDNSIVMAALAYVGPLLILSYLTAKDVPFVKFHIKQGLLLLVIEVALWFLGGMLWAVLPLVALINIALFILAVIGIINAVNKKEQALPVIGQFSKYFNF